MTLQKSESRVATGMFCLCEEFELIESHDISEWKCNIASKYISLYSVGTEF